jgi:hypothetical protein
VYQPDPGSFPLDDESLRELGPEPRLVHVPAHGAKRGPECLELPQHGSGRHVPGVQHEVCPAQELHAGVGQPPRAARQVRVAEDGDQTAPGRKRPSR